MLLRQNIPFTRVTQNDLALYEEESFDSYSRCSRDELAAELEHVLVAIVELRRDLHAMLTQRQVEGAEQALWQLLRLEARAAAVRRAHGDVSPPRPAAGTPQDRRKERRRTARDE